MSGCEVHVPNDMSYVNAFFTLWQGAGSAGFFAMMYPEKQKKDQEEVSTSEKVANIFKNRSKDSSGRFYAEYVGGRFLKIDFATFPNLQVRQYDNLYGLGAAKKAIESYARVSSARRFDQNDECSFQECLHVSDEGAVTAQRG